MELKDFTYTLTYSTTPFEKFNVPRFHRMNLPSLRIPLHIEFNKTYYMMMNDKLQAFRIIGISIGQLSNKDVICYFLTNEYVEKLGYKVRIGKGQIHNDWYWDNSSQQPKTSLTYISYLLITKGNVQIGLKNCDNHYKSKEECIKAHFNDYYIDDFEDDPFSVEIEVLPNKARKYILQFEEVF